MTLGKITGNDRKIQSDANISAINRYTQSQPDAPD